MRSQYNQADVASMLNFEYRIYRIAMSENVLEVDFDIPGIDFVEFPIWMILVGVHFIGNVDMKDVVSNVFFQASASRQASTNTRWLCEKSVANRIFLRMIMSVVQLEFAANQRLQLRCHLSPNSLFFSQRQIRCRYSLPQSRLTCQFVQWRDIAHSADLFARFWPAKHGAISSASQILSGMFVALHMVLSRYFNYPFFGGEESKC